MENSGKKYQIDTEENKMFLGELQKNLLNFGKGFLSPGGSAYFLGDDGTPWKDRNRETWITCRMYIVWESCLGIKKVRHWSMVLYMDYWKN